jgi:ADP-heptose:LPS heptosyltransferase
LQEKIRDTPLVKQEQKDAACCLPVLAVAMREQESLWKKLCFLSPSLTRSHKLILINLGSHDRIGLRKWPLKLYEELIGRLLSHQSVFIILIGKGNLDAMCVINHERCINLIGKTSLKELLALCGMAHELVSHDCGIVHSASLTTIRLSVLFGPETPLLYAPLSGNTKIFYKNYSCSPCLSAYNQRSFECNDAKCMKAITVNEVYDGIMQSLGENAAAGVGIPDRLPRKKGTLS